MKINTLIMPMKFRAGQSFVSLRRRYWLEALRVATSLVFCISGILKLINSDEFAHALSTYTFLPGALIDLGSLVFPHLEIFLGLLLAFGVRAKAVSAALVIQLVIFTSLGVIEFLSGREVDCGCFPMPGVKERIGSGYFIRNGLLILCCLWISLRSKSWPKAEERCEA